MEPLTHFQEDVLADILQSIHLQGTLYCRASMGAPWGLRVSRREVASFPIITEGSCWFTFRASLVFSSKFGASLLPLRREKSWRSILPKRRIVCEGPSGGLPHSWP